MFNLSRSILGSLNQLACLSFHETKNISCGEGGALLINDLNFFMRLKSLEKELIDLNFFVVRLIIYLGGSWLFLFAF